MPEVPPPEGLPELETYYPGSGAPAAARHAPRAGTQASVRISPHEPPSFLNAAKAPALAAKLWFRAVDPLPDDEALHRCLLAYVSDFYLLDTALMPHGKLTLGRELRIASIDHAMWFHRSVRVDDWLLYSTDSPSAGGARGFTRGQLVRARRAAGREHVAGRNAAHDSHKSLIIAVCR